MNALHPEIVETIENLTMRIYKQTAFELKFILGNADPYIQPHISKPPLIGAR